MRTDVDCLRENSTHIIYGPVPYAITDPDGTVAKNLFKKYGWYNEKIKKLAPAYPCEAFFEITHRTTGVQRHWSCTIESREHALAIVNTLRKQDTKPKSYVPEWVLAHPAYKKSREEIKSRQPDVNHVSVSLVSPIGDPEGEAELEDAVAQITDPTVPSPMETREYTDWTSFYEDMDTWVAQGCPPSGKPSPEAYAYTREVVADDLDHSRDIPPKVIADDGLDPDALWI